MKKNKEEIPINIKGVPIKLHKKFKKKCQDVGTTMTREHLNFMEMVNDGRIIVKRHEMPRLKRERLGGKTPAEITNDFNTKVKSLATIETVARSMAMQYYIGTETETGNSYESAEESADKQWKQWIAVAEKTLKDIFD